MRPPLYTIEESSRMHRRTFLAVTNSLLAAAVWADRATGAVLKKPTFTDDPFQLGVASGDPTSDGVVLWTRLAPKPLEGGGCPAEPIAVAWQVAEDEQMTKVVQQGTTVANPQWAHSVHVEVSGLRPDRWYWYRFRAGDAESRAARTRTAPPDDQVPARLRLAFASCQHFEAGHFTAYEHMAKDDLDLVLHLGDYIYEGASRPGAIRKHVGPRLEKLEDYRNRHAQYKTDPAMKAMHAAVPWVVTWDDHEVANNYAGLISEKANEGVDDFRRRRAAAYQAYYEHMPLRRAALPQGPDMLLYRRVNFGKLADFSILDTRQYRTDQPCDDGVKPPCEAVYDPNGTILGAQQREWMFKGLADSKSKWNVLAQQVMIAKVDLKVGDETAYSMDKWTGYEADRRALLKFLHQRKIANPVVLTGDIHTNWANELIADFDDLGSPVVGAEFVGTSITSGGNGVDEVKDQAQRMAENPCVKFHNAQRGYVRCNITPEKWQTEYQVVDYVDRPGSPIKTRASFVVESGRPQLNRA
jgi:alkaline phosphatase D